MLDDTEQELTQAGCRDTHPYSDSRNRDEQFARGEEDISYRKLCECPLPHHQGRRDLSVCPDAFRAWHAGIDSNTRRLYNQGTEKWIKYLKYFNWYKNYPNDAIYVDGDLNPVWDKTEAAFVARADAQAWSEYDYFRARWPGLDVPINFAVDPDPNNYSIGIETLGFGAKSADADVYTDAMYKTLEQLVADLSDKYAIPLEKGWIIGHEDVNPIGRFGWDPAPGFDWSIVYKS